MPSISEEEFDKLVHHTIRIDLTDGTELLYPIAVEEKQRLIQRLRYFSQGIEEGEDSGFINFSIYPEREVYINKAYMLRLIFCFDNPAGATQYLYRDNFNDLEDDEKNEGGYTNADSEDILLSQAIIKLTAKVGYQDSDILFFNSINAGDLAGFDMEIDDPNAGCRAMLELIDDDGENNFIPLKHIMCMEIDADIVNYNEEEEE